MNYTVLIIVSLLVIAVIIFLLIKNRKDKRELEQKIKDDYRHSKDEEGDIEVDDSRKV